MAITLDKEMGKQILGKTVAHTENVKKFMSAGVSSIRDCGIDGGDQGRKINELADIIEEKGKEAVVANEVMMETLKGVLVNIEGFDEADFVAGAKASAESVQKGVQIKSKKVEF